MPIHLHLASLSDTEHLAGAVAYACQPLACLLLQGEVGSGKTTFARFFLKALGWEAPVPSPTYALLQIYTVGAMTVHHFDLYRIKHPGELDEVGLESALSSGISLIEWPERLPYTPEPHLSLHFQLAEVRTVTLSGSGYWHGWHP